MKKVFLLSTAMVMAGSAAFADMKISGEAETGYVYDGAAGEGAITTDMELKFNVDTTTDGGLDFGAEAKLDGADFNEAETKFWAKGAFGKISLGDVDGAAEKLVADAFAGDSIGDVAEKHDGAFDFDMEASTQPTVRYDYARDAFEVSASFQDGEAGLDAGYALAGAYNFDAGMAKMRVAAATQKATAAMVGEMTMTAASVEADMKNGLSAKASYGTMGDAKAMGFGVAYEMGAMELAANYGKRDDTDGFGMAAEYDLGGSVKAKAGYGTYGDDSKLSMGLGMKF